MVATPAELEPATVRLEINLHDMAKKYARLLPNFVKRQTTSMFDAECTVCSRDR